MIRIPEEFARATGEREGEAGRRWITALPALVEELALRWQCAPAGPVTHGQVGLVVPVRRGGDGPAAVLKVSYPHPGNVWEPHALAGWAGRGAVRLHERDDARFAMLLERAEPGGSLAGLADVDEAVAVAGRLARRLAVPGQAGMPRLRDLVPEWEAALRSDRAHLADPLPAPVTGAAVATLRELGPDQPETMVHGDLHHTNVLRAEREPWPAIDPKGYVGDLAYDAATLLRGRNEDLFAAADNRRALLRRLAIFADAAEVSPERARRWSQLRATQAALWGRRHGDPDWLVRASDRIAHLLVA